MESATEGTDAADNPHAYSADPVGYCNHILKTSLTPDQEKILRHLLIPPCIVNVPSANDTGKTFLAACAVNWWYDSFDPGACYTLAPRLEHLVNNLWAWVRILRRRHPGLGGLRPSAPVMTDGPEHMASGITAAKGESFKGRHIGRKLFVMEEATGIGAMYHDELPTMLDEGDAVLYIYNPVSTTSRMYVEDRRGREEGWHRFPLSALNHPNITAELAGEAPPFRGAISLFMLKKMIRLGCEPIEPEEAIATDFFFPPKAVDGQWYRPGPWFQARGLGLWPTSGSGVWSESLFDRCLIGPQPDFPMHRLPEIGADMALGKGEDFHAIIARWGSVALVAETANNVDPERVFKRLKRIADELARFVNKLRPEQIKPIEATAIPIKLDDDGVGGAIGAFLRANGYNAIQLGAGTRPSDPNEFALKRDELWFACADRAKLGGVYLGGLGEETLTRLREQLCAPEWELDRRGRRCVEPKEETKDKIKRSPDDADAMNLAFYEGADYEAPEFVAQPEPVDGPSMADERGLFGRRGRT